MNSILNLFYQNAIDVLFLQETFKIPLNTINKLEKEHPDLVLIYFHEGHPAQGGIGYLARKNLKIEKLPTDPTLEANFLKFEITKENLRVHAINIYAPSMQGANHANFLKKINRFLKPDDIPFLILGDFNFVEEPTIDRTQASNQYLDFTEASRTTFTEIRCAKNLIDIYRILHPNEKVFTHFNPGCGIHSRLDRIYISAKFKHFVSEVFISNSYISDHKLIGISLDTTDNPKWGFGHPKMNIYYLKDEVFKNMVNDIFDSWERERELLQPIDHFILLKLKLWEKYTKFVKSFQINNKKSLENLYQLQPNEENLEKIFKLENFSNNLKKEKGYQYFKNNMEDEFLPFYCKNQLKNDDKKCIASILDKNGIEKYEKGDIIQTIKEFYTELYSSQNPHTDTINRFLDIDLPQVEIELSEKMKKPIHPEEVASAIKGAARGKTPGPDGIPMEFYLIHINRMKYYLAEYFNNIFLNGEAHESFNESILSLLYKLKGLIKQLKNWRPVSLLNTDYKILTKILANRMTPALPKIIHENQTCGVPGRSSFDNLYNLSAIVEQAMEKDERLLLVALDQEKAFDRIEPDYVKAVLRKFGFPEEIIKWYSIISTKAKTKICINGHLTELIEINRSIRQGCPVSMIIYILCIEPAASKIRRNKEIQGFMPINAKETKLSQFADDSTPILRNVKSYQIIENIFKDFGNASGSKLNSEKTKIVAFGKWDEGELRPIKDNIKPHIEILGVNFGPDMNQINWPAIMGKVFGILKSWEGSHLTLRAKIYIIQTYVLSNIWHIARAVLPTANQVTAIQTAISRMLWGGPRESIARRTSYLPLIKGGLGMPDVAAKLDSMVLQKCAYAKDRLISENTSSVPPWVGWMIYIEGFALREVGDIFSENKYRRKIIIDENQITVPKIRPLINQIKKSNKYNTKLWDQKQSRPFYNIIIENHVPTICLKYKHLPWKDIWKLIWHNKDLSRSEQEFLYLQFHEALPSTNRQNIAVPTMEESSENCRFCNQYIESQYHLFAACPYLQRFRSEVIKLIRNQQELQNAIQDKTPLEILVVHNLNSITQNQSKMIFMYALAYKLTVWKHRCAMFLGAPRPNLVSLINKFNSILRPITIAI